MLDTSIANGTAANHTETVFKKKNPPIGKLVFRKLQEMGKFYFYFSFFLFLVPPASSAEDIFKSDTINIKESKITRIIQTDKKNLSLSFNGGGFKSFAVSLKDIAKLDPEKLSGTPDNLRRAFISLSYVSPEKGVSKYVRNFLDDENVWVRWEVLNILYELGDDSKDTFKKSRSLFNDPSPDIRMKVCEFYEKYASKADVMAIYSLLWDESAEVRKTALNSLSKVMDEKSVINAAGDMLGDKSDIVRAGALRILSDNSAISEKRVGNILVNDTAAVMRKTASAILLKSGTSVSIPNLIKALTDEDEDVKANAKKALERIRNKSAIPL